MMVSTKIGFVPIHFNPVQKDGRADRFVEVAIKARPHTRQVEANAMTAHKHTQTAPQAITERERFAASAPGQERAAIRRAIGKSRDLNANRKNVLSTLVNLWFANRDKGTMHPGAERLAAMAHVSIRTVKTYLGEFRERGFIKAVAYEKGGRKATRYTVCLTTIFETLCPSRVVQIAGDLVRMAINKPKKPCKNCTRIEEEPTERRPLAKDWGDLSRFTAGFVRLMRRSAWPSQDKSQFGRVGEPQFTAPLSFAWCPF